MKGKSTPSGVIRVGVGGWSYAPWRETFYPPEVSKARELEYASRQLTAIEINSTFYRLQNPNVFARWRDSTPEHFMFSLKAPRFIMQRRTLADAGESIERFLGSGITELANRLGPILWQFAPNRTFDAGDVERFLKLLPSQAAGVRLRHVIEARHQSFLQPQFIALLRRYQAAAVYTDSEEHPSFADLTSDFVYARLMRSAANMVTGYSKPAIAQWKHRACTWAQGGMPKDLPRVESRAANVASRDVFIYFINGAKERAPAAARSLLTTLASPTRRPPKGVATARKIRKSARPR